MTIHFDFSHFRHEPVTRSAMLPIRPEALVPQARNGSGRGDGKRGAPQALRAAWIRCPESGRVIMQWRMSGG